MTFNNWKAQAVGQHIDVDGAYGAQCVDVYLDYIQKVIGVSNWGSVSGYGDAAELYPKANQDYFIKYDPSGIPQQGDVIFYGATATNPSGHVAVVDSADSTGAVVIEQNGFNPSGSCYVKFRAWNGNCIGWQRPKHLNIDQGVDMITKDDVPQVRIVMSEVEGWDGNDIHSGKDDAQIMAAWLGHTWQEFIYHGWTTQGVHRQQLVDSLSQMQASINTLSERPTNEEYAKVQAQLNDQITQLTTALKDAQNNVKIVPVIDQQTQDNVSATRSMVQAIFNYFAGQFKSFDKYNPFKKG